MAIFGDMFDLNHDGNIDPSEEAMEFMLLDHLMMEKKSLKRKIPKKSLRKKIPRTGKMTPSI